jgi:N-carbamoylputrescine amidase
MRITVCQWPDTVAAIARAWAALADHVKSFGSDLVVLPEMPFYPWLAKSRKFDPKQWFAALAAHDVWEDRMSELGGAAVLGTRPVEFGNERCNEGFVWEIDTGGRAAHVKACLANEEGMWEATWYSPAPAAEFTPVSVRDAHVGFLISTEIWAMEQARLYGNEGVRLLATPRVTNGAAHENWLAAGRVAAVVGGAFEISSNRADRTGAYGGTGWIIDPDGRILAMTSEAEPFATVDVDLARAERARATYPRYVFSPHAKSAVHPVEEPRYA